MHTYSHTQHISLSCTNTHSHKYIHFSHISPFLSHTHILVVVFFHSHPHIFYTHFISLSLSLTLSLLSLSPNFKLPFLHVCFSHTCTQNLNYKIFKCVFHLLLFSVSLFEAVYPLFTTDAEAVPEARLWAGVS